ncbi:MAG: hypothetical protein HC875_35615 [Anaerolineales bacterium]|nr:hypothetical protein [Anaerolineales bacterium]
MGQGWLTCQDGPVFAFNPTMAKESLPVTTQPCHFERR